MYGNLIRILVLAESWWNMSCHPAHGIEKMPQHHSWRPQRLSPSCQCRRWYRDNAKKAPMETAVLEGRMDLDYIQLSTLFWWQPAGLINLMSPAILRCSEWVKVMLTWNSKLKKHSGLTWMCTLQQSSPEYSDGNWVAWLVVSTLWHPQQCVAQLGPLPEYPQKCGHFRQGRLWA